MPLLLILLLSNLPCNSLLGQSFNNHKELLTYTFGDTSKVSSKLESKGFVFVGKSDSISVKYLDINEPAQTYINHCTNEIVKISASNTEYIFDGDKHVTVKDKDRIHSNENLLYAMTKKLEGGFGDLILSRTWWIGEEDTYNGYGAYLTRKFRRTYFRRVVDVGDDALESIVLYR